MIVGSLFSGIGGFDLGLERAGHAIRWQVEIDPACQRVLGQWWPEPDRLADVRIVGGKRLAPADLICGGFPCQDLSVAGNRAGLAGDRSGLWYEFARVIAELTPQWVLIENVPGLLSSNGGRDMGTIVDRLAELGYGWAYRVLDAQYFGVAQRRRRVFVVGCLGSAARAAAVLFEPESCDGDTPPSRSTREGPAASLTSGSGVGSNDPGRRREDDVNLVPALTAGAGTNAMSPGYNRDDLFILDVAHTLRSEGGDASEDGTGRGTPLVAYGFPENAGRSMDWHIDEQSPPLRSERVRQSVGGSMAVRRLTPTECERLQGFPDGWTAGQSDSVRYRQLGNAVCVPVAEWIGRRFV